MSELWREHFVAPKEMSILRGARVRSHCQVLFVRSNAMIEFMNDKELGKKMAERSELDCFIDAYECVTGQRLRILSSGEAPDFICARADETQIGVELTRGECDVEAMEFMLRDRGEPDFGYSALDDLFCRIDKKEKLRKADWAIPDNSILVVQMFFHRAAEIGGFLTPDLQPDFDQYGFAEIWLADYTTVEPYGGVELFGLKPAKWRGYHPREDFLGKRYG
jgi:hypothetical protein